MTDISKLAKKYGTPIFLIDLDKVKENFRRFKKAFPKSIIAYSYKTNYHPEILKMINKIGGFSEVISNQEIFFAEKIGVRPSKMIYDGIGRQESDFEKVINEHLFSVNVNSIQELQRLSRVAKKFKRNVEIGLRVNPNIRVEEQKSFVTSASRFGIKPRYWEKAMDIIKNNNFLKLKVIFSHIGANITNPQHYIKTFIVLNKLAGGKIEYMNLGGGFSPESVLKESKSSIFNFGKIINKLNNDQYKLIFEPGRYMVEDACYCITKVLSINNNWVTVDIGGNFLIPLANANYRVILPKGSQIYNFAGILLYAADVIQRNVRTKKLNVGKIIQINNAGAYTFSMRSNMGSPAPLILLKKNDKIIKYKDRGNPNIIFKNMVKQ